MSPHAIRFKPEPVRPVRYRTHRTWWHRLRPFVIGIAAGALALMLVVGVSAAIGRMYVTEAQLDAAFLQGMNHGQTLCWRP